MSERETVEARNVSMYPTQWKLVDRLALDLAVMTGSTPQTSVALRKIISEWDAQRRQIQMQLLDDWTLAEKKTH